MESNKKKFRFRLGNLEKRILTDLSAGDMLYGALLSAHSTKRMYKLAQDRAAYRHRCKEAIERLKEKKFIQTSGERLTITGAGENALGVIVDKTCALLQKRAWDKKWRIVVFDIPEKYSQLRDKIRGILKRAGFMQLQRSVWVFPHDCEELITFVKQESRLAPYILYGVLDSIESGDRLQKIFKLK